MTRALARSLSALLLLALAACQGNDDVGKPCESAEDCAEGLICDFHDAKGTCQEPHGHGGETAATTEHHDSDHEHTGSTSPTEATTEHEHGTTEHEHGTTEHEHTGTTADTSSSTG